MTDDELRVIGNIEVREGLLDQERPIGWRGRIEPKEQEQEGNHAATLPKKTSLNIREVTQRGRNREEAVSGMGACFPSPKLELTFPGPEAPVKFFPHHLTFSG